MILLVLGLGLFAEYRRRTGDIEFEVPGMLSGSWMDGHCHAVSNHYITYQDDEDNLVVYDILSNKRTKIRSASLIEKLLICDPWIVWEEGTAEGFNLNGYHLPQAQLISICTNTKESRDPELNGNIIVWSENDDIYGYSLQDKIRFPISMDSQREGEPDINGNHVVWKEYGEEPWTTKIVGYNLNSQKRFLVRETIAAKRDLQICGHYILWLELSKSQQDNREVLLAYNIESGEVIRVSLEKVGNLGIDSSGDIIVWDEDSPITSSSDIYGFN
ncbi:MAG: hypothetical protein GX455_12855, partial [Phycisphaerae bacterium]|nr:hypothetical protein [Phycisphaerae bacterium]